MTLCGGYALGPQEALEDLDMGDGSTLSLKVTGRQSNGLVTVIEGVALSGGPPLHVHEAEDEVVICVEGRLAYQVGDKHGRQHRASIDRRAWVLADSVPCCEARRRV